MPKPDWPTELPEIAAEARANLALFCALVALRTAEQGRAGREFGVLSESAPTYLQQLHVAAVSFRNEATRLRTRDPLYPVSEPATGLYTDRFLTDFSHRWAPLGAANDPQGMNEAHAANLIAAHAHVAALVGHVLVSLPL